MKPRTRSNNRAVFFLSSNRQPVNAPRTRHHIDDNRVLSDEMNPIENQLKLDFCIYFLYQHAAVPICIRSQNNIMLEYRMVEHTGCKQKNYKPPSYVVPPVHRPCAKHKPVAGEEEGGVPRTKFNTINNYENKH